MEIVIRWNKTVSIVSNDRIIEPTRRAHQITENGALFSVKRPDYWPDAIFIDLILRGLRIWRTAIIPEAMSPGRITIDTGGPIPMRPGIIFNWEVK